MTTKINTKRKSLCAGCSKRLSVRTASGEIRWQPSHVDDEGLYCEDCYEKLPGAMHKRGLRSKQDERHG